MALKHNKENHIKHQLVMQGFYGSPPKKLHIIKEVIIHLAFLLRALDFPLVPHQSAA